jgi:hypothetical protein
MTSLLGKLEFFSENTEGWRRLKLNAYWEIYWVGLTARSNLDRDGTACVRTQ